MGARPLSRVIQEHIKKPLANELLFGKLKKGGMVNVFVEKNADGVSQLKLECLPGETKVMPKREPEALPPPAKTGAKSKAAPKAKPVTKLVAETVSDSPRKPRASVPTLPGKRKKP
jgi:ATP-dependent Clp protease ATP-binding subunit ClpA